MDKFCLKVAKAPCEGDRDGAAAAVVACSDSDLSRRRRSIDRSIERTIDRLQMVTRVGPQEKDVLGRSHT